MNRTSKMSKAVLAGLIGLVVMAVSSQASALGDTWETKAPMPTAKYPAVAGVIDGKLYVSGAAAGSILSNNEAYDPATDAWSTKTPSPTSRGYAGAGVIDGKLYVVGGCIGLDCIPGNTNLLEVYDPDTNMWTTLAPMPTARNHVAVGVIDGKLYVVGGMQQCGPCIPLSTLEVYDPVTNTWDTTKAPMPTARVVPAAGVIDGKLYVAGGTNNAGTYFNTLEVYDPVTNTWDTTKAPMPTARAAIAGVLSGNLYVVGGSNLSDAALATLEAYDPISDTWTTRAPMPTERRSVAVGVINGLLYAAGGQNDVTLFATLEVYTPIVTPEQAIQNQIDVLQGVVDSAPGTPLADKMEDAQAKAQTALAELTKTPPDNQAAVGNIEGAVGDLEAAVKDGLLDAAQGTQLMDQFAAIARQLALDAVNQAIAQAGDPTKITEAQQALADGDALRTSGRFKDAVNKYKDALAKAESALA